MKCAGQPATCPSQRGQNWQRPASPAPCNGVAIRPLPSDWNTCPLVRPAFLRPRSTDSAGSHSTASKIFQILQLTIDLAKKTAFVLSERNGQSIVLQGLATLSAMSSIVSDTARLPLSLLNKEKKTNSNSTPIKFSLMANGLKTGPLYRPPSNSCRRPRLTGTGRRERLLST